MSHNVASHPAEKDCRVITADSCGNIYSRNMSKDIPHRALKHTSWKSKQLFT